MRHDIGRLSRREEKDSRRRRFADMPLGYVHIDSSELRLAQGRLHMLLAIDRVTKFTHAAFFEAATKLSGAAFAEQPRYKGSITDRYGGGYIFERVCRENGIGHRFTKPYHPWTHGQAERVNRTVKEATIEVFHSPDFKAPVLAFVAACNFSRHLKALRWRTPFQTVCDSWTRALATFKLDPRYLNPGPNRPDEHRFNVP